jgi:hypothetical protein
MSAFGTAGFKDCEATAMTELPAIDSPPALLPSVRGVMASPTAALPPAP